MMGVSHPLAQQVAIMHDLVEDTEVTLDRLRQLGFAEEVVAAVDLVTHQHADSYADYVIRLKENPLAREVKLADLRDNASLHRVLYRADRLQDDLRRLQRYMLSYQFLMDRIDATNYRARMLELT
jgi:(p)ppGpp synthase/HD superfamily hydrolase